MPRSTDFSRERTERARRAVDERSDVLDDGALGELAHERPVGSSSEQQTDWGKIALFGAGLAIGLAFGAGAALLWAPQTGEETREVLGERARELGGRVADQWDDLRDEMRWLGKRGRKSLRRGLTRSRWAAEDALARGRHRWL